MLTSITISEIDFDSSYDDYNDDYDKNIEPGINKLPEVKYNLNFPVKTALKSVTSVKCVEIKSNEEDEFNLYGDTVKDDENNIDINGSVFVVYK